MKSSGPTRNESHRLKVLDELRILDTELEECFDDITRYLAEVCKVPICLISLVDKDRQWFKSRTGLDASETPRDQAFCAHAIHSSELFEVKDAHEDSRFMDNPLVTGYPHVSFYAGQPLEPEDGVRIGTLCVIDRKPRKLNNMQKKTIAVMARQVEAQLKLRRMLLEIKDAEKAAYMAAQEKAAFLAQMSHEIRTPMGGIIGLAELLIDEIKEPKALKMASTIKSCTESLMVMLNGILDLSKIESKKIIPESKEVNLKGMISGSLYLFEFKAESKGILLTGDYDPKLPEKILSDEVKLTQVLNNLIGNAIKFTEKGSVSVRVRVRKNQIEFTVNDTGIGIQPKSVDKIFDYYVQADETIARKFGGTGLGLAISKGIIEALGGRIEVDSKPGVGSCFRFRIPLTLPESSEADSGITVSTRRQPSILVAEDNQVNQDLIRAMLKKIGYKPVVVSDGKEAVEAFRKNSFDLVFTDIQMPVMDGYEAIENIRNISRHQEMPWIVTLSANSMKEQKDQAISVGANGYMEKPVTRKKLIAAIEEFQKLSESAA